jgi:hypothetical protein
LYIIERQSTLDFNDMQGNVYSGLSGESIIELDEMSERCETAKNKPCLRRGWERKAAAKGGRGYAQKIIHTRHRVMIPSWYHISMTHASRISIYYKCRFNYCRRLSATFLVLLFNEAAHNEAIFNLCK